MSKFMFVFELNSEEQDNLWIHSECPKCKSIIIEKSMNCDEAYWKCNRCDVLYVIE